MKRTIAPHAGPQSDFLSTPADIAFYGGAAGGGKTFGLLLDPLRHARQKGFTGVIFRRKTTEIRAPGGLWQKSQELYHLVGARSRESDLTHTFPSGAQIKLAHMEHEKDRYSWQGAELVFVGFDEATHFTERQFWYVALSRARSVHGMRPYVRATCNPDPDSFVARLIEWWIDQETGYPIPERSGVLRWFVRIEDQLVWSSDPEDLRARFSIEPKSFTFIPAKLEDNPTLNDGDPGYGASLDAMNNVERERLKLGNWKIREPRPGIIWTVPAEVEYHDEHPDWKPKRERLVEHADMLAGWDYGSGESLLVCLMALVELEGGRWRLWLERELTWQQTAWMTAAADWHELRPLYGGRHIHFGDPAGRQRDSAGASWEANLQSGGVPLVSLRDIVYDPELVVDVAGKTRPRRHFMNSRAGIELGIRYVQTLLDTGRLRVNRRCNYTLKCLRSWARNVPQGVDVDEVSRAYIGPRHDVYSHGAMALVYLVAGAAAVAGARIARARRLDEGRLEERPAPVLVEQPVTPLQALRGIRSAGAVRVGPLSIGKAVRQIRGTRR